MNSHEDLLKRIAGLESDARVMGETLKTCDARIARLEAAMRSVQTDVGSPDYCGANAERARLTRLYRINDIARAALAQEG